MRLGWLLAVGAACAGLTPAWAQVDDEPRAMVQALPNPGSRQLNAALNRLAANPRDVAALLDAGHAALSLGDTEAALGFFGRADQLAPGDPRVKSALASAMVRNEDPFAAIPLFEAAERAGARDALLAGERGLAYDLVGDNATAQGFYRQALAAVPGHDEIARRLALSLAIAGDRAGSEAALHPQIRRNDRAAWRTRAFALAILGETEEAVRIANATMPRDLAAALIPYLRYMGRLTPAQQAAAANFGHFPRAAQIGRDDPRVARYAALNPRKPAGPATASASQASAGRSARGDSRTRARRRDSDKTVTVATVPSKPASARAVMATPATTPAPAPAPPQLPASPPVRIAAATPVPLATVRTQEPVGATPMATAVPGPSGATPDSASAASLTVPAPVPVQVASVQPAATPIGPPASVGAIASHSLPASNLDLARRSQETAAPQSAAAPPRDFAAAFGDFRPPAEEQRANGVAVDLAAIEQVRARRAATPDERGPLPDAPRDTRRTLTAEPAATAGKAAKPAAKPDPKAKPKPAAPSHPSRIWVQLGVGRDKGALAFDWRKHQRTEGDLFKGRKAWTTPWGQTNRLLIGPFETQAAAQALLKSLRKEEMDAFVWTSPAGQAVDALAAK
ncbi:MAG: SPOR domain-containing protein [Novosphingobium sp.]|nr:SPOR domain-containing protein [Novosphingobium sp.]